jgi:type I restriction enzyme S subunit
MRTERLKRVAEVRVSNVDKKSTDDGYPVNLCNYTDVYYNERITGSLDFMVATATPGQYATFGLHEGDVVLTKDSETADDIGVSAIVAETVPDLVCGYHLAIIRPRSDRAIGTFLRWVLSATTSRERMAACATGVTRFGLRSDAIADLPVPLPSIDTQRAIAEYLDRETDRIDALVRAKRRMVELLKERTEVARDQFVTGVGEGGAPRKEAPAWLGSVPSHWTIERLKYVARMDSGHTPDRKVPEYWVDCTIPWVTLNDVGNLSNRWSISEPVNFINELGMANSTAHLLPRSTVILSRDATVGRAAILARPMAVSQHFVGWTCGPRLVPEYLLHVLRGPMQRHFATLTAGATIATIGMPELNQLVIPLPPIEEQRAIVERMADMELRTGAVIEAINHQTTLLQEHRRALITAAVTGALDIPSVAA